MAKIRTKLQVAVYVYVAVLVTGLVLCPNFSSWAEEGTLKWVFDTNIDGSIDASPAIGSDGTIYVVAGNTYRDNYKLYAINQDGTQKWAFETEYKTETPVIGSDDAIYIVVGGYLYAINPNGSLKWSFEKGPMSHSPAIGSDGTIYVGSHASGNDGLYALNPDGTQKWFFEVDQYVYTSPAIASDGTIYVGAPPGRLYAINPDGTLKWFFIVGHDYRSMPTTPAIVSDGTIYVGSKDNNVYAINPNGTQKWTFYTGGKYGVECPVIGSDGTIYAWVDCDLHAINPDGTQKWIFKTDLGTYIPAIGSDGTIYARQLYAINPDGTQKWAFETTGGSRKSPPTINSDGTIYVGSGRFLYAINSSSEGLADSSWPMFQHDVRHTGNVSSDNQKPREENVIPLTSNIPYQGIVTAWHFNDFSLETEAEEFLLVEIVPTSGITSLILDAKLGNLSIYAGAGDYTTREKIAQGKYELLISPTQAGTYYFSLFGYSVEQSGSQYTITARYVDNHLSDVSPRSAGNAGFATLSLKGIGFTDTMQAELSNKGLPTLKSSETVLSSPTELFAQFNLSGVATGSYDVTVIWQDNSRLTLPGVFEIVQGVEPKLEASLSPPQAVRPNRKYTLWLEYKNTGNSDMQAPLLTLTANCPISLDKEDIRKTSVQILAIGNSAMPGILRIGESQRIPVYFIAPSSGNADFNLSVTHDSNETIDWPAQKDLMKPASMTATEWDTLFPALTAELGNTWTQYLDILRSDAFLLKQRGKEEYDVREYIRIESRQAAGEPTAAASGILRDADTKLPVKGVFIKVQTQDDTVVKGTETAYYPEGHFVIANLPDGTYEVYTEGYYFETPQTITITGGQDKNGLVLYAKKITENETPEQETEIPDHNPSVTKDEAGNLYLAWQHGNEIWWAVNSGNGWNSHGQISDAQGFNPVIAYDPELLDNNASPGLICTWESGVFQRTIAWSVAKPAQDSITWSEPQALTSDNYDDFGIALILDDNHMPLILWLQKDSAIEDDADLYYENMDINESELVFITQKYARKTDNIGILRSDEKCERVFTKNGKSLPKWIPVIGGKYAYELRGDACGSWDCYASLTGKLDMDIELSDNVTGTGSASATANWKTDTETCQYLFKNAKVSLGAAASGDIPSYSIPVVVLGIPIGKAEFEGNISGNVTGTLTWKSRFPGWPDKADVLFHLEATPKGTINLLKGGIGGSLTGTGTVEAEYSTPPSSFEFKGYCITLNGKIKLGWGLFKKKWKKQWGSNCSGRKSLISLKRSHRNSLFRSAYSSVNEDIPVYEEFEYEKKESSGTGKVYEGSPILPDISQDIYEDGLPATAKSNQGEIIVAWTKDFPAANLGSKVYAASYNGTDWNSPVEITPDTNFNKHAAIIFGSDNTAMAAWSGASNNSLDYNQSSVEDILNAQEQADIMYSRRTGGTWTTPEPLAVLTGRDEQVHLAAGLKGEITAAWINQSDSGSILYASVWNGTGWSEPLAVSASELAESPSAVYISGKPMIVWAQDSDENIDTFDDWIIYSSSWNGTAWSSPESIMISEPGQKTKIPRKTTSLQSKSRRRLTPPDKCCEEKPEPPDPPKDPIGDWTAPRVVSVDPNEKVNTTGISDQHYISSGDRLRYTVYFENKKDAQAPAQEVFITDCLDKNLDWTTLRLEEVAFGSFISANPKDSPVFNTRITIPDYRAGKDKQWWVYIFTELDGVTGCLKTTFRTLDPETEDLPEDAFAGLLPPEDGTGRGQGYITLSLCTKKDVESGTILLNKASIVFDTNDPIITNEVFNTARYVADIDGDKAVTLADAILALKILSGISPQHINMASEVNTDGKIGLEEVVYTLQAVSDLNPKDRGCLRD